MLDHQMESRAGIQSGAGLQTFLRGTDLGGVHPSRWRSAAGVTIGVRVSAPSQFLSVHVWSQCSSALPAGQPSRSHSA
jgi:hypothetical protein